MAYAREGEAPGEFEKCSEVRVNVTNAWEMIPAQVNHGLPAYKVSDSPGLVDFAIRPVNSVFNLPDRQVMFFEESE